MLGGVGRKTLATFTHYGLELSKWVTWPDPARPTTG